MKWYTNNANQSDIVLSTRVRLARNLCDYPFPTRLDVDSRNEVNQIVKNALIDDNNKDELSFIEMSSLSQAQAVSLAEKHLISPEFASNSLGRALILSKDEDISIMLCEEDHVRIQVIYPGLSLEEAFEKANGFDEKLEKSTAIAFDEKLGFLTQCPTNLGTGLRASVMLHLPALARSSAIHRLASTVAKLGLTLRGAYGEGSQPIGDIFQLSNQVTLGISEKAAIQNLNSIALQITQQEKQARASLLKDDKFIDKIWRSYGILKTAHMLSCNEFTDLISLVRLGASQGMLDIPLDTLSRLLIEMQPATINAVQGKNLTPTERDVFRAKTVKETLG